MKNVILVLCSVLLFNACKKSENLTSQQFSKYSGIKNVNEFDEVMNEIITTKNQFENFGNRRIKLSKNAIEEMHNSIQFDKEGRFRGFLQCRLMKEELTLDQRAFLFENLIDGKIIIFDKNSRIIKSSKNEKKLPWDAGEHDGWRWLGAGNCCGTYAWATCVTYGGGILC